MTIAVTGLGIGGWVDVVLLYAVAGRGCWLEAFGGVRFAGGRCWLCWTRLFCDASDVRREAESGDEAHAWPQLDKEFSRQKTKVASVAWFLPRLCRVPFIF